MNITIITGHIGTGRNYIGQALAKEENANGQPSMCREVQYADEARAAVQEAIRFTVHHLVLVVMGTQIISPAELDLQGRHKVTCVHCTLHHIG